LEKFLPQKLIFIWNHWKNGTMYNVTFSKNLTMKTSVLTDAMGTIVFPVANKGSLHIATSSYRILFIQQDVWFDVLFKQTSDHISKYLKKF
jgi:hypothetical protein